MTVQAGKSKRRNSALALPARVLLASLVVSGCAKREEHDAQHTIELRVNDIQPVGESDVIARVLDMIVAQDTIWVLNSTSPFFIAFGPSGSHVRSWGQQGGGPLELGNPVSLVEDEAEGSVWAYDASRHRLRLVNGATDRPQTMSMPYVSSSDLVSLDHAGTGPGRPWIAISGGSLLVASAPPGTRGTARIWQSAVSRWRDHMGADTVIDVRALFQASTKISDAAFMQPHPLWARCPDGALLLYDPADNVVRRLSGNGQELGFDSLPAERREAVTVERLARLMYQREASLVPSAERLDSLELQKAIELDLEALGARVSSVFPEYADLHCTASGAWIQPFDPESSDMGRGPSWLRVGRDGRVQEVRFPDRFVPMRFEGGRAWGILRSALDVPIISWVDIPIH